MASASNPPESHLPARLLLRRLFRLARPEWRALGIGLVFLLVGTGMSLAYPQAIRVIIDHALGSRDTAAVDAAAVAMLIIFFVQGIAIALRHYLFTLAGERIVARLRSDLYQRILAQEIAFFDERRTGELTSRLSTDTTVLQNTVSVNVSMALRNAAAIIGGIILLFYTSPILTVLMLAVVPPLVVATRFFGRRIRAISREYQDALAKASEIAEETISGIRTVRAFAREKSEGKRYGVAIGHSLNAARRRIIAFAVFGGVVSFAGYGAVALVLWYGGHLVHDKHMSVGDLTSFILYTLIVAFSLSALGSLWADFMRAAGASERVFELRHRVPKIPATGGKRLPAIQGEVALRGVSFAYPSRPQTRVLTDVSAQVSPGEVVALVGPSGGGKSTLVGLIPRFYDCNQGNVTIDGHDVRQLDATWLREQIGIVSQEPILMSDTVAANIRYGRPDATPAEIETAAQTANAHEFVAAFPDGYETLVGERGTQLSAGQKQRIAIARAVLKDPRILILDEATSALDASSEHLVQDALDRLMRGRTTWVIAHRLSTVMGANRVMVIEGGRIVQVGCHADLMREETGLYRRLVQYQLIATS